MSVRGWARLLEAGTAARERLLTALVDPAAAQQRLLQSILRENADTAFGRAHGFDRIDSLEDFQARVPIRSYEDIWPWIERIATGETDVLSVDRVIAFEQTGGSSGGRRLIPYTQAALDAFQRGVLAWIADLCLRFPAIATGRAYFAVSPALRNRPQPIGGLPVGLESDAAYFGTDLAADLGAILVGAQALGGVTDSDDWLIDTLTELVAAEDLTLISVWSPTFLTMLLDGLATRMEQVSQRLSAATDGPRHLARYRHAMRGGTVDVGVLWPRLQLVSAWADAASAPYADPLRARLGKIAFQPKGLLATEGVFTVPLTGFDFPAPALNSAFLEFLGDDGAVRTVEQLRQGDVYELIVTTPGGLYRYRIGDYVACRSQIGGQGAPLLSFVGRASDGIDLVGDKLDGAFIAACLREAGRFAVLAPGAQTENADAPGYVLIVDKQGGLAEDACEAVERALRRNPLYDDAIRTGQLRPLRTAAVKDAHAGYIRARVAQDRRLGDIKVPLSLQSWDEAAAIWPCLVPGKSC